MSSGFTSDSDGSSHQRADHSWAKEALSERESHCCDSLVCFSARRLNARGTLNQEGFPMVPHLCYDFFNEPP